MKIILANPRGFCAGVNMAMEALERAMELFGLPIYVFHEIIHNRPVVEHYRSRGVVFVDDVAEVPEHATLLYSAHGVAPAVRALAADRKLHVIDATCPLVAKVHLEAVRFAREDYTIVLIGHQGHDEVVGTMGEAPARTVLVETIDDVERLPYPANTKVAFLTQTTLSVDETQAIIEALQRRFPSIIGPSRDDICYATQNRQEAVKALAPQADAVLVVGSPNSSNSTRLAEIALGLGKPAFLIDRIEDLPEHSLDGFETVLLTAGASASEGAVQACVQYLHQRYAATVESPPGREESVAFPLPQELRIVSRSR